MGFSHSTDAGESSTNDFMSSTDNVKTIREFFKKFPELSKHDFYLSSESYGGHYTPQLTLKLFEDDDKELVERFKGFLLGNPYVGFNSAFLALAHVAWGRQVDDDDDDDDDDDNGG